jgi:hypothetical protein
MDLIMGLAAIASGLYLAYMAGADEQDRAKWEDDYADNLVAEAGSRGRHPSR